LSVHFVQTRDTPPPATCSFPHDGGGLPVAQSLPMLLLRTWLLVVCGLVGTCVLVALAADAVGERTLARAERIKTLQFVVPQLEINRVTLKGPEI
jgi:hypothetical protein